MASAQFAGGSADGHAQLRLTNVTCLVVNANPFAGGASDGHTNVRISNIVCAVINSNPYAGGNADGHANFRLENDVCVLINVNPYAGGEADGHTNLRLTNVTVLECEILVLPIQLLTFNALANEKAVDLNWVTASEVNNDFFTVEKSEQGIDFHSIARVSGAGNSTKQLSYSAVDAAPYEGINYYRLKQTDFDGKFSYSTIVSVDITALPSENQLYPNPNDGKRFYVKLPNSGYRNIRINIQSVDGKVLLSETVYEANTFEFFPSVKLTPGVYIISISDNLTTSYHSLLVK